MFNYLAYIAFAFGVGLLLYRSIYSYKIVKLFKSSPERFAVYKVIYRQRGMDRIMMGNINGNTIGKRISSTVRLKLKYQNNLDNNESKSDDDLEYEDLKNKQSQKQIGVFPLIVELIVPYQGREYQLGDCYNLYKFSDDTSNLPILPRALLDQTHWIDVISGMCFLISLLLIIL